MQIREITVTAGRTFNNPYEQYSNLRPEVKLVATLDPGDDPNEAAKALQAKAEGLVEDHKNNLLKQLDDLQELTKRNQEIANLEHNLKSAQARLTAIREEVNSGKLLASGEPEVGPGSFSYDTGDAGF